MIKREIGDRHGEAAALSGLGNAYDSLGQYQQAIDFHQQSLVIEREIGDCYGEASALGNLGNGYYSLGQYRQAIEFCQQALAIKREIGDRHGEAAALGNLGSTYGSLGQYRQAIDFYQQAVSDRSRDWRSPMVKQLPSAILGVHTVRWGSTGRLLTSISSR